MMNLCRGPHKHQTRLKIIWTYSSKEEESFSQSEARIVEKLTNIIHTTGYNLPRD